MSYSVEIAYIGNLHLRAKGYGYPTSIAVTAATPLVNAMRDISHLTSRISHALKPCRLQTSRTDDKVVPSNDVSL